MKMRQRNDKDIYDEIEVGDEVRTFGHYEGLRGIVTRVIEGRSVVDHGMIEVRITHNARPKKFSWLEVGDLECFVHFGWRETLALVKSRKIQID
jgi:preprotein translocase subunit YajC